MRVQGASPYGPDLSQWPAKFLDIWNANEAYFKAEENALNKAASRK